MQLYLHLRSALIFAVAVIAVPWMSGWGGPQPLYSQALGLLVLGLLRFPLRQALITHPFFVLPNKNNLTPHNLLPLSLSDCTQLHQRPLSHLCLPWLNLDLCSRQPARTPTMTALGALFFAGTLQHHPGAAKRGWGAAVGRVPWRKARTSRTGRDRASGGWMCEFLTC